MTRQFASFRAACPFCNTEAGEDAVSDTVCVSCGTFLTAADYAVASAFRDLDDALKLFARGAAGQGQGTLSETAAPVSAIAPRGRTKRRTRNAA